MRSLPLRFAALLVALLALTLGVGAPSHGQDPGRKVQGKKTRGPKAPPSEDKAITKSAMRGGKGGASSPKTTDRLFSQYDRDGDGVLAPAEMSDTLRTVAGKWDANGDGSINRDEYLAYFDARVRDWQADRAAARDRAAGATQPQVFRAGKLPPGLPAWFAPLDRDGDAQVGLYEWKESRWTVEDFRRLDRNDDGFLTTAEVLWHVDRAKTQDTPEKAILNRPLSSAPRSGYDRGYPPVKKGQE